MSTELNSADSRTPSKSGSVSGLDRWFEITQRGSNRGREVRGGLVTFFAMAYIIALNPLIIGTATDKDGNLVSGAPKFIDAAQGIVDGAAVGQSIAMVAAATALVAGVMTLLMGIIGRYPIGVATGLGLNAMLAYVVAPTMTWPQAMGLVVWEGIIVLLLVLTGLREAIFRAVPPALRTAMSVAIGLFITLVGLVDAGVIRPGNPLSQLGINGSLIGWPILVFILTLFGLLIMYVRNVKGAMLWAIFGGTVLAIIFEATFKPGPQGLGENPTGWALNVPAWPGWEAFGLPNLGLLGRVDLFGAFAPDGQFSFTAFLSAAMLIFSLLLADFFDTIGTVMAVGTEGKIFNEDGEPPHLREILLVDSLGAIAGGLGSTSSNTSFIESASGVGEGARTGFASVVTGLGFILAMFLSPVINMVPSEAVAPVLVLVGFLMMSQIGEIDWTQLELAIPAFLTIVIMPFTYSITDGLGAGFISYALLSAVRGKAKQVHPMMWVVAVLFLIYFLQGIIAGAIG